MPTGDPVIWSRETSIGAAVSDPPKTKTMWPDGT
jgi:hypothetical protein